MKSRAKSKPRSKSNSKSKGRTRTEADAIGAKKVPVDAYGGIFWTRARENFSLSDRTFPFLFFQKLALIKMVAANEHVRTHRLDAKKGNAIAHAAREIMRGKEYPEFSLDVYQAGAGTPLNMTMNEVLANRALETLGQRKGKYSVIHPNSHVNMGQSTNDVIPTAIRLTAVELSVPLERELIQTVHVAEELAKRYSKTLKTGRTHVQTAVPVTFGQELRVYAESLRDALRGLREAKQGIFELSLGGTAVGTGITTEPGYDIRVVSALRRATGQPFYPSHRKMLLTSHMSAFGHYSSALSGLASELTIWANDWVLLGSDPHAGIGEIVLSEMEPGSSIMPGKINPSILEALKMICLQVQGNHETIRLSLESTQLELNVMTPVLASNLFESQQLLTNGLKMFRTRCLAHVHPSPRMKTLLEQSVSTATALNPYLGYDVAAHLVKKSLVSHISFEKTVQATHIFSAGELLHLLHASALTSPRKIDSKLKAEVAKRKPFIQLQRRVQSFAR